MDRNQQHGGVFIGAASILVIFIVLCLTTFAALSLVSANADLRMSERTARTVQDYYAADTLAVERRRAIEAALTGGALPAGQFPEVRTAPSPDGAALDVSYAVPVNDRQELQVSLRFPGAGRECEVLRWRVVNTAAWTGDESLTLWDGGTGGDAQLSSLPQLP